MPSETVYFEFTDWTEDEGQSSEEVAGINMMSMLFCKHGGLITPVTSGQIPFWEFDFFTPFNLYEEASAENKLANKLINLNFSQEKIDSIIAATQEIYNTHGIIIDPICLLAIIAQEGTGSFNTSSTNLAGDGQHGKEVDFQKDLLKANNLIFGKVIGYILYGEEFKNLVNSNKELLDVNNANVAQYANWNTPYPGFKSKQIVTGVYAGHSKWHEGVTKFYETVRGKGRMEEYSDYLASFDEEDAYQILEELGIDLKKEEGTFNVEQIGQNSRGDKDGTYIVTWTTD